MPVAREALPHDRERADDAEDRVQRHRDRRDDQRDLERVHRVRVAQRVPEVPGALVERAPEDHRERREQHDEQVAERDEAQAVLYARSCLVARQRTPPIASSTANEITSSTTATADGAGLVAALDVVEDEDRRDLGLERQVPGDEHERADLADRARERERDAGEDPGEDVRQDDAAEDA